MKRAIQLFLLVAALAGVVLLQSGAVVEDNRIVLTHNPTGIMDTHVELTAVVAPGKKDQTTKALKDAEATLRKIEKLMSAHLADSDISKLNKAKANEEVPLSPQVLEVLTIARDYNKATGGVFDITVRPLLEMWKAAGKAKKLPTDAQMKEAMDLVGWDKIKLSDKGATKLKDGVSVDLGGIAKKYAIDLAADSLIKAGVEAGIVNIGGDIRVWGIPKNRGKWRIGVRHPFEKDDLIATMRVKEGAVATSGNYERFVVIDGKRYSHIVDPRTGKTADFVPSVTVTGKTAVGAGIWATALSVLGTDGYKLMTKEPGLEAMIITGGPKDYKFHYTDNFTTMMDEVPEEPATKPAATAVSDLGVRISD